MPQTRINVIEDPEKLQAIGRVISNWAYYEQQIVLWLNVLLNQPKAKDFPKNLNISFKRRVRLWRDLAKVLHWEDDKQPVIQEIIDRTAKLRDDRDWYAHGWWGETNPSYLLKTSDPEFEQRSRLSFIRRKLSAKNANIVADRIADLAWEHTTFYQLYSIKLGTGRDVTYYSKAHALDFSHRSRRRLSNS